ncbi:MAG: hypothetical protein ABII00_13685 [Elusimicrobiota bacterium]
MRAAAAVALLLMMPARAAGASSGGGSRERAPGSADPRYVRYSPPSRTFSCEIPSGWTPMEEPTPRGSAVHIVGPQQARGAWRAAYHIHFFEKDKPGFVPSREALKAARRRDAGRDVTGMSSRRVARRPARVFQVHEKRLLPAGRLPAELVALHHFYVFVPSGSDDYFVIKLSTTEEAFLDYRRELGRFLESFRVIGY